MMNLLDFLSVFGLFGNGEENKAYIDPINKKLSLISLGLILISVLLIYIFKIEIFQMENLFSIILWSFAGSILISIFSLILLNHFKIIHSLVMPSFIFSLISSSTFLTVVFLLVKI